MRHIITIEDDKVENLAQTLRYISHEMDLGLEESINGSKFEWKSEKEYDCEYCEDTGEVDTDETDSSGNVARGVGTRKCVCRLRDEEDYEI